MKKRSTPVIRRMRSTREANHEYSGMKPMRTRACPAAAYDFTSAPPPARINGSRTVLQT